MRRSKITLKMVVYMVAMLFDVHGACSTKVYFVLVFKHVLADPPAMRLTNMKYNGSFIL